MRVSPTLFVLGCLLLLGARATESPDYRDVVEPTEVRRQVHDFEQSLKGLGIRGKLDCSLIIELVQATPDHSFGAICEVAAGQPRRTIMVCDDTMIGKFTLKSSGFAVDRAALAEFTRANSPGGG